MQRKASAVWKGGLKDGRDISAPGGALKNTPYSFTTRFENAPEPIPRNHRGGSCGMFFDGAVGATRWRESSFGRRAFRRRSPCRSTNWIPDGRSQQATLTSMEKFRARTRPHSRSPAEAAEKGCPVSKNP